LSWQARPFFSEKLVWRQAGLGLATSIFGSNWFFALGAYGEVRKCLSKETNALRAVKIINKKYLEEEEKAKLLSEISILKQMDHPNILKLYEFFQDPKRYFLVTE
jgi:serine/threonine protein kinase